jgi:hypothetical protein
VVLRAHRWKSTVPLLHDRPRRGKPSCLRRGGLDARRWFRCRTCEADFTIASGTLFDSHKLPLKGYLAAIAT